MKDNMFQDGTFFVGCNYWASHAGTNMWRDWRPDVIDRDFALLAAAKVDHLRIFPLWSDFQPIKMHRAGAGAEREMRLGEDPLPHTEAGRAGVSQEMADRFEVFCDLAQKHGIKLIVGLITGWMSGRYHVPEPFETVNVLRDPQAIKWQIKFVRYMVSRFRTHKAIVAWDLGNECNCLGPLSKSEEGYVWVSTITMAIRTEDRSRPVISGMHGTFPESAFKPDDLGEILDVLCTHPYPLFTEHCMTDPITEQKSVLHAAAETVMYRGLSGKPAFSEEVGTLGPFFANEENAASYINTVLYLLWAHNCLGFMWWCGFEQLHLTHTPYDWDAVERELGLFHADYSPKPVLGAISSFADFIQSFSYKALPGRIVDAVCILSAEKDSWLSAFGTFILAKQAGLDIEFCYITDEIPEARAYILPSFAHSRLPGHVLRTLLSRVEQGAVLYLSIGEGFLSPFKEYSGLQPLCRYNPVKSDIVSLCGNDFTFMPHFKVDFESAGASILARDDEGKPVMSQNDYGKGTVYFLSYPIEDLAGGVPGINSPKHFTPYYLFYETMDKLRSPEKIVRKDNPHVAYTEHIGASGKRIVTAVNCVPYESTVSFTFNGYSFLETLNNQDAFVTVQPESVVLTMRPNSAVVFEIKPQE